MTSIQQRLDIALQKAHFGDNEIAIKQLIEVIREQQKQIQELKEKEKAMDKFISEELQEKLKKAFDELKRWT